VRCCGTALADVPLAALGHAATAGGPWVRGARGAPGAASSSTRATPSARGGCWRGCPALRGAACGDPLTDAHPGAIDLESTSGRTASSQTRSPGPRTSTTGTAPTSPSSARRAPCAAAAAAAASAAHGRRQRWPLLVATRDIAAREVLSLPADAAYARGSRTAGALFTRLVQLLGGPASPPTLAAELGRRGAAA